MADHFPQETERIVGDAFIDERRLRSSPGARDLDDFLRFLEEIEALFGEIRKPRRINQDEQFLF